MSDTESEDSDIEMGVDVRSEEDIRSKTDYPRCKKCKRYRLGHDKGTGDKCSMSILDKDELEKEDRLITEIRVKTFKRNLKKKKTSSTSNNSNQRSAL